MTERRSNPALPDALTRQAGFTLVELMVAMVLSLFLIGGAILINSSGKATYLDSEQLSRGQESIRFASDFLIRDLRNAGFRDELLLKVGHEQQIRQKYAEVTDGGEILIIRYAGRGHCTQNFETFRLVENQYSLADGELQCRGRSLEAADPGSDLIEDQDPTPAIGLVSGVTDLSFRLICPPGVTNCGCDLDNNPEDSCIGVEVGLQFQTVRDLDNPGAFEDRFVELVAAFRNADLGRIFQDFE